MRPYKYFAVEGPIGVGKTTLAQLLADQLNAKIIMENFSDNPFLEKFYADMAQYAFHTQIFFLLNRYQQQISSIQEFSLFHSYLASDYIFQKDKIFAYLTLNDPQLKIYEKIYATLEHEILKPDLIIYLKASSQTLMERIKKRNRPFENAIREDYLLKLNIAYNHFFKYYTQVPVYSIDTEHIDIVGDIQHQQTIIDAVRSLLENANPLKELLIQNPDSILKKEN